jgi:nitroreductase
MSTHPVPLDFANAESRSDVSFGGLPDAHAAKDADPARALGVAMVDEAIVSRRSVRAFLATPIAPQVIADILRVASRAPSGTNLQPWQVRVLSGAPLQALCDRIEVIWNDPQQVEKYSEEYAYYPRQWISPFIERRREVGWKLYQLLKIEKGDRTRTHAQHGRNFRFFDAPVGMIFTIHRILEQGSWLDYGMFLQNIMVAARARGLDTCPQAAFTQFHKVISDQLGLPEDQMVVCAMALGYADPDAIENTLVTSREPVVNFAHFDGFGSV